MAPFWQKKGKKKKDDGASQTPSTTGSAAGTSHALGPRTTENRVTKPKPGGAKAKIPLTMVEKIDASVVARRDGRFEGFESHNASPGGGQQDNVVSTWGQVRGATIARVNSAQVDIEPMISQALREARSATVLVMANTGNRRGDTAERRGKRINFRPDSDEETDRVTELPDSATDKQSQTGTVKASTASRPMMGGSGACANCLLTGHKVKRCVWVREDGYIHGCPIHNTTSHRIDECREFLKLDLTAMVQKVIGDRQQKPPFLTGADAFWVTLAQTAVHRQVPLPEKFPWTPVFGWNFVNDRSNGADIEHVLANGTWPVTTVNSTVDPLTRDLNAVARAHQSGQVWKTPVSESDIRYLLDVALTPQERRQAVLGGQTSGNGRSDA